MITCENFVFSRAAVARMLKIDRALVKKVEVWTNCVFVLVVGKRPRFWKKSDFQNHFVDYRKEQSTHYNAVQLINGEFQVWNNTSRYTLKGLPEKIQCTCEDYVNQQRIFKGKGCCKHGYAVLSVLGFNRLSEYVENHRWLNTTDESCSESPKDERRKKDAKNLKVSRVDFHSFIVRDPQSKFGSIHHPELKPDTIKCTCEDYKISKRCKHGYAVLNSLGFEDFFDYIHQFEYLQDDYKEIDYEEYKKAIFGFD